MIMKSITAAVASLMIGGIMVSAGVAGPRKSHYEMRAFIIDTTTKKSLPDLAGISATLDILVGNEAKKTFKMGIVGNSPVSENCVCGEVKGLDKWFVELVLVRVDDKGAATPPAYTHTHGGPYFAVTIPHDAFGPSPVRFKANLSFEENGKLKDVKGFEYPHGLYAMVTGNIQTLDLKGMKQAIEEGRWSDASAASQKMATHIRALPPLVFKDAKIDFEKTRENCITACRDFEKLAKSNEKDAALKAIERCNASVELLKDQAKSAEGARLE